MQHQVVQMKRVLTTPALVAFGLAYMVPLGIFTTYGQVTQLTYGHLPVAYVITLVAVLFTAFSYCRMIKEIPLAGSAYSYVQKTFGGNLGFLVGWTQILDYLFLPILNYLVIGIYMHEALPSIPAEVFVLVSLITVSALNILGIKLINSINFILLAAQFIFIGLFLLLCFYGKQNLGMEALMKPLLFTSTEVSGLFSGAAVLCLAFLGFDAIATLAEEAKEVKRTLPRAIIWTVVLAGTLFIIISYAAHLSYPDWQSFPDPDTASLMVVKQVGGQMLNAFFISAYVTGVYASAMTSQTSIARIFFAMGREGVLSKSIFSAIHRRFHTPYKSILVVAFISLSALFLKLEMVVSMISFGALGAFTFVNLSVIKRFLFDNKQRGVQSLLIYGLMPAIGLILSIWLWTHLDKHALQIGLCWLAAGLVYLAILTRGFRRKTPSISDDEYKNITD